MRSRRRRKKEKGEMRVTLSARYMYERKNPRGSEHSEEGPGWWKRREKMPDKESGVQGWGRRGIVWRVLGNTIREERVKIEQ